MPLALRPASIADRPAIYGWLARSDATPQMMGPPRFTDHPVPSFEAFCADYDDAAFTASGPFALFVMVADGEDIGAISYFIRERIGEIDLWIGARENWGQGYGSRAIGMLADRLFADDGIDALIIRPSARNKRAIGAYIKAGFEAHDRQRHRLPRWVTTEGLDYEDAVVLVWPRAYAR